MCTVRLFLQLAPVTIRFIEVLTDTGITVTLLTRAGFFPELFFAHAAQGIEARLAFCRKGIATPVQVGHDGIPDLTSRTQKTVVGFLYHEKMTLKDPVSR
jgi:hypothetical protein